MSSGVVDLRQSTLGQGRLLTEHKNYRQDQHLQLESWLEEEHGCFLPALSRKLNFMTRVLAPEIFELV
jgi:hypothetical protein